MSIFTKVLFSLSVLLFSLVATASDDIGQVKTITGDAVVIRNGESQPLKAGDFLQQKDVIVTSQDSAVGITFIDNTRYSTGPNTRLALKRFRFDSTTHNGEFVSEIEKGTAAITSGDIAKHNKEAMKVFLPNTILAVRGTKFLVMVPQ